MTKQSLTHKQQEPATSGNITPNISSEAVLVGIQTCLEMVFPDPATRPGKRTFLEWKARRFFPSVKIGKRVFCDPRKVREALERRFEIPATETR